MIPVEVDVAGAGSGDTAFVRYMSDAMFLIPTPQVLQKTITGLDDLYEHDIADLDMQGDLYEYMRGRDWSEGSNKAVMGLTLNKATLMDIGITVPSLETRRDAIEKLNKISDIISVREEQFCKLDELVKSRKGR